MRRLPSSGCSRIRWRRAGCRWPDGSSSTAGERFALPNVCAGFRRVLLKRSMSREVPRLRIGDRTVGSGEPLFVIAEIGLNHGGSVDRALALVEAAASAGASAVKLQTLVASELVAPACPPPGHVQATSLRDFFAT